MPCVIMCRFVVASTNARGTNARGAIAFSMISRYVAFLIHSFPRRFT